MYQPQYTRRTRGSWYLEILHLHIAFISLAKKCKKNQNKWLKIEKFRNVTRKTEIKKREVDIKRRRKMKVFVGKKEIWISYNFFSLPDSSILFATKICFRSKSTFIFDHFSPCWLSTPIFLKSYIEISFATRLHLNPTSNKDSIQHRLFYITLTKWVSYSDFQSSIICHFPLNFITLQSYHLPHFPS